MVVDLYWLLEKSHRIKKFYPEENILRGIIGELKADNKHDITSIFRLPGTFNYKDPENIKRVKLEKFPGVGSYWELELALL